MLKEKLSIAIILLMLTFFIGGNGFPLVWNNFNEDVYKLEEDNSNIHTITQDYSNIHPLNQDLNDIQNSPLYKSRNNKNSEWIEYIIVKDSTGKVKSIIVTNN